MQTGGQKRVQLNQLSCGTHIFTDFRRELIAKTLFDLLKIAVAAAFASKFFFEFPKMVKLIMWFSIMAVAVVAILLAHRRSQRSDANGYGHCRDGEPVFDRIFPGHRSWDWN